MMKILLIYFSGTGNTKKIALEYKTALEARGNTVDTVSVPLSAPDALDGAADYDLIGIGYPIHAFNAPKAALDACKRLPKLKRADKKRAFVFKTSGEPVRMSDVSSLKLVKLLSRRGYEVKNECHYVMPYNIIFRHTDEQAYKMWQTAKQLVPLDADEILDGIPRMPKRMFMGGFLAWLLRIEHGGAHLIGKSFGVDKNACTRCGMCVKNCPKHNIRLTDNGKIKFGWRCDICMRCSFNCPKDALKLGILKKWKVNGAYSFDMPAEPSPETEHDDYCKKAYDRYYADAQQRIVTSFREKK